MNNSSYIDLGFVSTRNSHHDYGHKHGALSGIVGMGVLRWSM